ncbi:MAG: peptidylprolyl isomerase [Sterolibacteriaceae bacterium MAG5]|nr:peptidylprolyl isomerase [Candidatus Nitricoxidireducens bremensis]
MQVAKNTVVTLQYRVTDSDGNLVDEGHEPLVYLHGGYGGIFDKIEETIQGMDAGAKFDVRLQPDDAFGDYDAELVMIEPRNLFPDNIEVGMQFERGTEEGDDDGELYTITDIAEDKVVVDGNHPLAGMVLVFSGTIAEVRAASDEEIAHGHVHAPGGHHHH